MIEIIFAQNRKKKVISTISSLNLRERENLPNAAKNVIMAIAFNLKVWLNSETDIGNFEGKYSTLNVSPLTFNYSNAFCSALISITTLSQKHEKVHNSIFFSTSIPK